MNKNILFLVGFCILYSCSASSDNSQIEYFKDFQTQVVNLQQRVEVLEARAKQDTNIKSDYYAKVDKLDEKVGKLETNYDKIKNHPLFEGLETVKLSPAPSTTVISIKSGAQSKSEANQHKEEIKLTKVESKKPAPEVKHEPKAEKQEKQTKASEKPSVVYNRGYELYNAGKYAQAISIFRDFLDTYPKSDLADNAQYWIGECYYAQKIFDRAITEFKKVEELPDGNKIPDSYLKIYYALNETGKKEEAKKWGKLLLDKYKDSPAAKKIQGKISQ